jgi:hypothetical protein
VELLEKLLGVVVAGEDACNGLEQIQDNESSDMKVQVRWSF